ncbi:hypothetical protein VCR15J2_390098 [Vibrio coralliirubri]|uniref:hypothetical protein n=1 Tax=Vibrio coralliirubri TaxID=1516159 RepID=UPI0006307182|nr:hypothetical protein [Vibrio coralliirubri]CDT53753.1 hypothetical protein VCR15J2_390098 [Vibrio coralliirubri]
MHCLDFIRLRQEMGQISKDFDLSEENVVITECVPVHRDLWTLMFHHGCQVGDITGNITSGDAVIAWIDRDGKVHTSNSDNHFLEDDGSGEKER